MQFERKVLVKADDLGFRQKKPDEYEADDSEEKRSNEKKSGRLESSEDGLRENLENE